MKKYIISLLVSLSILSGCAKEKPQLHIYYSEVCANCQALEKSLLPKLENEDIDIIMHDIDDLETKDHYLATLDKLEGVSESLKENLTVPFIALEGHFAMVGYHSSMDEVIIELIQNALNNKELSLPSGSWLYQKKG